MDDVERAGACLLVVFLLVFLSLVGLFSFMAILFIAWMIFGLPGLDFVLISLVVIPIVYAMRTGYQISER